MMQPQTLDVFAFSGGQRIVQNQKGFLEILGLDLTKSLKLAPNLCKNLGGILEKMMQTVGIASSKVGGDFSNGSKLHKPDQTCEVNQEISPLGSRQNLQERSQIGRNLFRAFFAHGFRVLLALAGIGDFGRKPFYLRSSTASLCLKRLLSSIT